MDVLKQLPATFEKLSSNVGCIKKDLMETKVNLRRMDDRLRGVDERLSAKLDALRKDLRSTMVWVFSLHVAQGLCLLFALGARGL
jgi:hypothetical protein